MKVETITRGGNNDNPNKPPKAGAGVYAEATVRGGNNDNPNKPPKAGASVSLD